MKKYSIGFLNIATTLLRNILLIITLLSGVGFVFGQIGKTTNIGKSGNLINSIKNISVATNNLNNSNASYTLTTPSGVNIT